MKDYPKITILVATLILIATTLLPTGSILTAGYLLAILISKYFLAVVLIILIYLILNQNQLRIVKNIFQNNYQFILAIVGIIAAIGGLYFFIGQSPLIILNNNVCTYAISPIDEVPTLNSFHFNNLQVKNLGELLGKSILTVTLQNPEDQCRFKIVNDLYSCEAFSIILSGKEEKLIDLIIYSKKDQNNIEFSFEQKSGFLQDFFGSLMLTNNFTCKYSKSADGNFILQN